MSGITQQQTSYLPRRIAANIAKLPELLRSRVTRYLAAIIDSKRLQLMSASPPKADIAAHGHHVTQLESGNMR